jgi:ammonia channel protein AmtB
MQFCRKKGLKYQAIRKSQQYDTGSMCNGILAGLVAITASCDVVEPWAAICIGIIAGFVYSFFSKLVVALDVDDPLEAASVHYANGIWGLLSCFIFDSSKGFISGNIKEMRPYMGVQIYGAISVTLWGIVMAIIYFGICNYFNWLRYHPLYEFIGAHKLKMGDITKKFLNEIREKHMKRPSSAETLNIKNQIKNIRLTEVTGSAVQIEIL